MKPFITKELLEKFIVKLNNLFAKTGRLYLIGETTQVWEGWRPWTDQIEFTAEVALEDRLKFEQIVADLQQQFDIEVIDQSPEELIPLPAGYKERALAINLENALFNGKKENFQLYHFDPYSVAFRFIARGNEEDYHLTLLYLKHDWINLQQMDRFLSDLLPEFSTKTIQQDPAEFRRKYKGLLQIWRS